MTTPGPPGHLPTLGPAVTVFDGDVGDPFLLDTHSSAGAIVFGTGTPPYRIPTATSPDLVHWQQGPDAFPDLPTWSAPDPDDAGTWAPVVRVFGDHYLMYLTVPDAASHSPCLAVATARKPGGPYRDALGHPLLCQPALGGAIDPAVAVEPDGDLRLLWKSNGICCTESEPYSRATLWSASLRPDGLAIVGQPQALLSADESWQHGVIEEPAVVAASGGGWWLFYSGDGYDQPGYSIGLAWCRDLTTPCAATTHRPLLTSVGDQRSPGGLEVFRRPDGSLAVVFDTWNRPPRNGRYYCCRSIDIAPLANV
jgi:beta-xylosidase